MLFAYILLAAFGVRHVQAVDLCLRPSPPLVAAEDGRTLTHIHVVYSTQQAHFAGLLTSMISLASHLQAPTLCTVHLVVAEPDVQQATRVAQCFNYRVAGLPVEPNVVVRQLRPLPFPLAFYGMPLALYWTRIFLHEYLPASVQRAIWLDHDTIVRADLGELYRMRMEHALAGAPEFVLPRLVRTMTFRDHVNECKSVARFVELLDAPTFNTGVLLLDLGRWRGEALAESVARWAVLSDGCFLDQLALNLAFQGKWDRLHWHWNARFNGTTRTPKSCVEKVRIFHWNTYPYLKYWQFGRNASSTKDDYLWRPYAHRQCGAAPWVVSR